MDKEWILFCILLYACEESERISLNILMQIDFSHPKKWISSIGNEFSVKTSIMESTINKR